MEKPIPRQGLSKSDSDKQEKAEKTDKPERLAKDDKEEKLDTGLLCHFPFHIFIKRLVITFMLIPVKCLKKVYGLKILFHLAL